MSRESPRVVVTGMGVTSGLGHDLGTFWSGLAAGRSCISSWADRDPRMACKVGGDQASTSMPAVIQRSGPGMDPEVAAAMPKVLRGTNYGAWLTACAAAQAHADAGLQAVPGERVAHLCAGQNLSIGTFADNLDDFREHPDDIEPLMGMIALDTDIVGAICQLLALRGPSALVGGACASGNLAVIAALDLIRCGRADAVVVSGAAAAFHPMILHAWAILGAVTFQSFNDEPTRASRPFDVRREGFVPSEAGATVVLESLASAERRGATIRAEILGGASTSDANRLPKPHVDGQVRAIRGALHDAGVAAGAVDYVNAHATSTPLGDEIEVEAIKTVLGSRAYEIPVNATKSMIGHALTSAALLELVATVLQIEHGVVHPTINLDEPSPGLDLDFVPNQARPHMIDVALSNSFGFGGINSAIAVGRIR